MCKNWKNVRTLSVLWHNTCDIISPNNLLIIAPLPEDVGQKVPAIKWDSILKNKFGINPINIRPKENTKYKKLDISYTNLDLYASFSSSTYLLGDDIIPKLAVPSNSDPYGVPIAITKEPFCNCSVS